MILSLRQQAILDIAKTTGRVNVDELTDHFNVTAQTIRKDLNELCDANYLTRVHGGAFLESGVENVGYEQRRNIASDAKKKIGQIAASLIPDNASLFINIGTTTEAVAKALLHHKNLLVITNNINVVNILAQNNSCELIIAGGVLRRQDGGIIGEATTDFIKKFKVDYAVIGVSSIDPDGALLDYDYREVQVSQAIIENSRTTFLVADQTKFNRFAPVRIGHIAQIDHFFTDKVPVKNFLTICKNHKVTIHEE